MSTTNSVVPTLTEQRKEAHQDGTNFVEDEKEFLKDEHFENNLRDLISEELSIEEKKKLTLHLRAETFKGLSADYKRKLKERKEAALRGVHIELDEEMKEELRKLVARLTAEYRERDNALIKQADANIQRLEDEKAARMKEEARKLKIEERKAQKGTKQSEEIFKKRLHSASPKKKSNCCELF